MTPTETYPQVVATQATADKQSAMPEPKPGKSRRNVLKLFAALVGGAPLAATAFTANSAKATKTLPVLETRIAGFAYYQGAECLSQIKSGDSLHLQRQAANPHDGKAIEVFWQGKKIGYVPKSHNGALSKLMDSGEAVAVSVSRVLQRPWEPLEFNVYLRV